MLIRDIMSTSVVTLNAEQTLREAVNVLRSKHIRHLPIVEGDHLIGIITDRDVKRATPSLLSGVDRADYDRVLDETTVAQCMTREPLTVTPDTELKAAVRIFIDRKMGALPVVEDGRLVGIVSQIDLLRVLHDRL